VRLRDLIILTVHTAQVAVTEKDIAGAMRANQRRLFAEVWSVRGNDRQAPGIAGRDLIIKPIVQTVARADGTTLKQRFECFDASF
jgi:hypothetical protein